MLEVANPFMTVSTQADVSNKTLKHLLLGEAVLTQEGSPYASLPACS